MTPFFTFLQSWMTPLFIIPFYPIAPLFLQSHITQWPFFHCGICILVIDRLEFFKVMLFHVWPQWPPFYNWLPNDPQFCGFFYPNDPTFIALGTEWPGFYSSCLLNDPIFWRVHILPDRPLLLTWSRHIPVTSDRECPPPRHEPFFVSFHLIKFC